MTIKSGGTAPGTSAQKRAGGLLLHPAPFPKELAERAIKLLTYRRDLVVDPFNGSGTTTAVAKQCEWRFIGIDQSPSYYGFARQRVAAQADQRPLFVSEQIGAAQDAT